MGLDHKTFASSFIQHLLSKRLPQPVTPLAVLEGNPGPSWEVSSLRSSLPSCAGGACLTVTLLLLVLGMSPLCAAASRGSSRVGLWWGPMKEQLLKMHVLLLFLGINKVVRSPSAAAHGSFFSHTGPVKAQPRPPACPAPWDIWDDCRSKLHPLTVVSNFTSLLHSHTHLLFLIQVNDEVLMNTSRSQVMFSAFKMPFTIQTPE